MCGAAGTYYLLLHRYAEAEAEFRALLASNPENYQFHMGLREALRLNPPFQAGPFGANAPCPACVVLAMMSNLEPFSCTFVDDKPIQPILKPPSPSSPLSRRAARR